MDTNYCEQKYDAFIAKIESEYSWSCIARLPSATPAPAGSNSLTTEPASPKVPTSPTVSDLSTAGTTLAETKSNGTAAARDKSAIQPSSTEPAEPLITTPKLSSAIPPAENREDSGKVLSMNMIRQFIPSGRYTVDDKAPHSGNVALCPADGFFIWSTKRPQRPAFEMGPGKSFQFDLTQLTNEPKRNGVENTPNRQCHEEITAGYCSGRQYTGSTPLHSQLSRHFNCGLSAGETANERALVLFRSSVDQTDSRNDCSTNASPNHFALASAGVTMSTVADGAVTGIELVILPNRSKNTAIKDQDGAICHYIRG